MSLELSSHSIELIFLGLFVFTLIIIFSTKYHLWKQSQTNLTEKHKGKKWSSPLEARTKYPELNTFAFRSSFLTYGLAVAIGVAILALSWTIKDERSDTSFMLGDIPEDIEIETPRTMEPPPPPPPTAMSVVMNDMPDVKTVIFEDQSITEDTYVDAPVVQPKKKVPPPPPPPPPPVEEEREIFRIVEEAPTFPGCEDMAKKEERKKCAEEKMLVFLSENIHYPQIARENHIQGMVVLQFVVEKDGSISNVEVVRDIGGRCGEEAVRVVKEMPIWNPGKQRGRAVRVRFTLPVRFILA